MSLVRWALVAMMALAAVGAWVYYADLVPRSAKSAVQYRCPMHPSVITDYPSSCPICGMDLVPVGTASPAKTGGPAAGQGEQAGRPAATPAPAGAGAPAAQGKYWCPMHPEVHGDDPNAVCEKCGGMRLVPRGAAPPAAAQGVPGLVPVDLTPERVQLIGMQTTPVTRQRLAAHIRTVGAVTARENALVVVATRFGGWIENTLVDTGTRVRKGDVLATAYSPEVLTAIASFVTASKWTQENSPAGATGAPSSSFERDARARLELIGMARQDIDEVARTREPQRSVNIRSPIGGFVAKKSAVNGIYVTPGTELFELADLSTVWVTADLYEYEAARVRVGQKATVQVPTWPGESFHSRVQFIYPTFNTATRTLPVRIELRNAGLRLRPGMYAQVELEVDPVDALVVPVEAVVDTGDFQYLFVVRDAGRFEPRRVKLGVRTGDRVQLLEGVSEGEAVVTTGNFLVDSESRLRAAIEGFAQPGAAGGQPQAPAPAAPASGGHAGHGK
jgi:RND family efflux transporter MFP subunit